MSGREQELLSDLGIHRIEIPNRHSSWVTNAYLIEGDPLTMVDTGVATSDAYDALASALSDVGRTIEDVGRIILTHGHADHRALASRVGEESGAEILFHPLEAGRTIEHSGGSSNSSQREIFRSMGVPEEHLPGLVRETDSPLVDPDRMPASCVDEGDEIDCGVFSLKVLHTPGHSCGSICLYEENSGVLFSGDTILSGSHITAMLEIDIIRDDPDYNSLKLHMESLRRLVELNASRVLPGHGEMFAEYSGIVDELLERHRKRRRHILRSLRDGPRPLYRICKSTFLFAPTDELFLTLSEVSGNIGILMDEGKVRRTHEGDVAYYEKA